MTQTSTVSTQDVQKDVLRFWRHVFGGQSGLLQIWTGVRNKHTECPDETLKDDEFPEGTINSRFFDYPKEAQKAAEWASERSLEEYREVYFCTHLLTARRRIKDNAAEVVSLWGEQDGANLPNGDLKPSAVVESSPGHYHVYWRLSDPIPPETAERLTKRLALEIGADKSGFDLTQLLRVPHTTNCKYPEQPVVKINYIDGALSYEPGGLDAKLPHIEEPKATDAEGEDGPPVALDEEGSKVWRGEDPKYKEDSPGEIDRSTTLMKIGRVLYDAGANRRVVTDALKERDVTLGYNKYTGNRDGGDTEYNRIFTKLEAEGRNTQAEFTVNGRRGNGNNSNNTGKHEPPTHDALRDRWLTDNPDYAHGLGEWRRYDGGVWGVVKEPTVEASIMRVLEASKSEGTKPNGFVLSSVHKLARIDAYVADELWDADPNILVAENGCVDLSTGDLLPHAPTYHVTTRVPYTFDPDAQAPSWHAFIGDLDADVAAFLQEFAGYCLTTWTHLEKAIWLVGPPGGGKSTFLEGLIAMLGDRAGVLGLAEIEKSHFAVAKLVGKTLVTAAEQPAGYVSCHHVLNAIISGELIQIERKYRNPYDLAPRAKIAWAMNEAPRIPSGAEGLFRRVEVIRFPSIAKNERNPDLKEDIKREGAGVLNWALEGLERLRARGRFDVPTKVQADTEEFRHSNDIPAVFVAEACVTNPDVSERASELYKEYKYWCEENGHRAKSSTSVADDWQRLGFERYRSKGTTRYRGVRVKLPGEMKEPVF